MLPNPWDVECLALVLGELVGPGLGPEVTICSISTLPDSPPCPSCPALPILLALLLSFILAFLCSIEVETEHHFHFLCGGCFS